MPHNKQEFYMTIFDMFQQSAILTVLGMAVVFAFLWVMIICVNLVGKIIHATGADQPGNEIPIEEGTTSSSAPIAAISAAIAAFTLENE